MYVCCIAQKVKYCSLETTNFKFVAGFKEDDVSRQCVKIINNNNNNNNGINKKKKKEKKHKDEHIVKHCWRVFFWKLAIILSAVHCLNQPRSGRREKKNNNKLF